MTLFLKNYWLSVILNIGTKIKSYASGIDKKIARVNIFYAITRYARSLIHNIHL